MTVRVQTAPFDLGEEVEALRGGNTRVGAVVTFLGTVRDLNDAAEVSTLTLEHYPGMTERALAKFQARNSLTCCSITMANISTLPPPSSAGVM